MVFGVQQNMVEKKTFLESIELYAWVFIRNNFYVLSSTANSILNYLLRRYIRQNVISSTAVLNLIRFSVLISVF